MTLNSPRMSCDHSLEVIGESGEVCVDPGGHGSAVPINPLHSPHKTQSPHTATSPKKTVPPSNMARIEVKEELVDSCVSDGDFKSQEIDYLDGAMDDLSAVIGESNSVVADIEHIEPGLVKKQTQGLFFVCVSINLG